jgi:hypothetical protein
MEVQDYRISCRGGEMRKVKITEMGPLGFKDRTLVYSEDTLFLTTDGTVKPLKDMRVDDQRVSFFNGMADVWTITKMEEK